MLPRYGFEIIKANNYQKVCGETHRDIFRMGKLHRKLFKMMEAVLIEVFIKKREIGYGKSA
jgi:hypothetical protein